MGIRIRKRTASRQKVRVKRKTKTTKASSMIPGPKRLELPLREGEVCIECFEVRVSDKPTLEFRIMDHDRNVLGMGTLFAPTPEHTARQIRLGRVGLILCGSGGIKRLEPLR